MAAIRQLDDSFDRTTYNTLANHPLQSWEWGTARSRMGIKVVRIGRFENDRLAQVFQFTVHPIANTGLSLGYLPRSINPPEDVILFLLDFCKKNRLIFMKLEPYETTPLKNTTRVKIVPSPHALFPPWTQTLDLTPPEDELLKRMKQKTRYNIRLAVKKGVTVREMSDDKGFEIFQKLYFETCARQKYYGHTRHYHEIVWNSLKDSIAHILIAYFEDTPLAAYELFNFNGIFYYPYGGTAAVHRNLMAANLIMWEAIRLGKKLGAKKFDMWGSLPPQYDPNHSWSGFTRFKEGYGGQYIRLSDSWDLVAMEYTYPLYNAAYKLREMYLTMRKLV